MDINLLLEKLQSNTNMTNSSELLNKFILTISSSYAECVNVLIKPGPFRHVHLNQYFIICVLVLSELD